MPARIEIKPILADTKLWKEYGPKFERYVKDYLRHNAAYMLKKDLEGTAAGWKHKPSFSSKLYTSGRNLILHVFPTGKNALNWVRVTKGTKSRRIVPKKAGGKLVFPKHYSPHTIPHATRNIVGGPGERYGPIVATKAVRGHKIRAREFEAKIAEVRKSDVDQAIEILIKKVFG